MPTKCHTGIFNKYATDRWKTGQLCQRCRKKYTVHLLLERSGIFQRERERERERERDLPEEHISCSLPSDCHNVFVKEVIRIMSFTSQLSQVLTTQLYGTVIKRNVMIHGVAPGPMAVIVRIAAIILFKMHSREHGRKDPKKKKSQGCLLPIMNELSTNFLLYLSDLSGQILFLAM